MSVLVPILIVVLTVAVMEGVAYAFADYGLRLWPGAKGYAVWLAIVPILVLSLLNAAGVMAGKTAIAPLVDINRAVMHGLGTQAVAA